MKLPDEIDRKLAELVIENQDVISYLFGALPIEIDNTLPAPGAAFLEKGQYKIKINLDLIDKTNLTLKSVLYHETSHILLNHFKILELRFGGKPAEDQMFRFNIATDFEINREIPEAFDNGITQYTISEFLKPGVSVSSMMDEPAEVVYDNIVIKQDNNKNKNAKQGGAGGPGQTQSGNGQPKQTGVNKFAPDIFIDPQANTKAKLQSQLNSANSTIRNLLERAPENIKNQSLYGSAMGRFKLPEATKKIRWEKILAMKFGNGKSVPRFRYGKPPKMKTSIIRRSVRVKRVGRPLIVIDTSGSISEREFKLFLSEVNGLLKRRNMTVDLAFIDTEMKLIANVSKLKEEEIPMCGGTDFEPVYQYIVENRANYSQVLFMTDGYVDPPDHHIHDDIFVILTEEHASEWEKFPYIVLELDE